LGRRNTLDVGHVFEELLERDPHLDSSERGAETLVDAGAEAQMPRDLAPNVEGGRVREHAWIEVRSAEDAADEGPCREAEPCDGARLGGPAEAVEDRAFDARGLLDGVGNEPWRPVDLFERGGIRQELIHHETNQARRRLVAGDQKELCKAQYLGG